MSSTLPPPGSARDLERAVADAAAAVARREARTAREIPLRFTGESREFFRIWIVNLCLTVATLGLYSPWAKVRARHYLYANTVLDGSSFEYVADPKRILLGRLLVLAVFAAYSVAGALAPAAELFGAGAFVLAFPWLAVQSTRFHHRNTRYRGMRFGFAARYADAAKAYLGWGVLTLLSLGLAFPFWQGVRQRFLVAHSRFGRTPFGFSLRGGPYYGTYLRAVGAAALPAVGFVGAWAALGLELPKAGEDAAQPPAGLFAFAGSTALAYLLAVALFQAVSGAGLARLLAGSSSLGPHRFRATHGAFDLLRLYVTSGAAVVLSLGLLLPWARIRIARYRAEHTRVVAEGDLSEFVADAREEGGEVASEVADVFGFDFGL